MLTMEGTRKPHPTNQEDSQSIKPVTQSYPHPHRHFAVMNDADSPVSFPTRAGHWDPPLNGGNHYVIDQSHWVLCRY